MILDAEQARERARRCTPTSKLVEQIMQDIRTQCDEGKFRLVYWPEGENIYTIRHAIEALCKLGYMVTYNNGDEGISLWINWEE